GMRLFLHSPRDSRKTAIDRMEEARRILNRIGDAEGEATTLGTIAAMWYQQSAPAEGSAAMARALEIWQQLGRQREEGIALADLGVLAYLAYDHPTARGYYERALPTHRAAGDGIGEATTLVRTAWLDFAAGDMASVIERNREALPI